MQLHYRKTGEIGRITLTNPPTNALTRPVFADEHELRDFIADPDLKAVIVAGQGRHFCSGADPATFAAAFRDPDALRQELDRAKKLMRAIALAPLPVAAAIVGSCLGAGLEIALACHFRFAATSAMFGFPESGHGLMPGLGGTLVSPQAVARRHLIELIASGRMIGADEALGIGLVDFVHPAKNVEREAIRYLEQLTADHPPRLIRAVMTSIHNGYRMPMQQALAEETRLFCELARDLADAETDSGKDSR